MLLLIQTLAFARWQRQRRPTRITKSVEEEFFVFPKNETKMKKQRMADGSLPAVACSDSKILHPQHTCIKDEQHNMCSHVLDLVFVHVVVLTSCHQIFLEFCMLGILKKMHEYFRKTAAGSPSWRISEAKLPTSYQDSSFDQHPMRKQVQIRFVAAKSPPCTHPLCTWHRCETNQLRDSPRWHNQLESRSTFESYQLRDQSRIANTEPKSPG